MQKLRLKLLLFIIATYSINFSSLASAVFMPANDECANAIALTPDVVCNNISATNVAASDSGIAHGCANYSGGDVWFSVVIPASGSITITTSNNGGFNDSGMAAYTDCSGATQLDCDDDGGQGNMSEIVLTGQTPGSTVYIAVWEFGDDNSGTFDICATEPAPAIPNDNCSTAIPLPVNMNCVNTNATNVDATDSGINPGCASFSGGDVWFEVIVPASGNVEITTASNGGITDTGMAVYSDCPANTLLACDDDGGAGTMSQIVLTNQTPGATLYVAVWEYGNNNFGTFDICAVEPPPPPPEDECDGSILLTQEMNCMYSSGSIDMATDSGISGCAGTADDDVWFSFVATSAMATIDVDPTFDGVVELFSGNCNNLTSIGCGDDPETIEATTLTPGQTYFIRVYSWSSLDQTNTDFQICVYIPVDCSMVLVSDCDGAEVVCDDSAITFTPCGPGSDDFSDPDNDTGCLSFENETAWYYFEIDVNAPPDQLLEFIIDPLGTGSIDYDFALYGPDVDCGELGSPIRCSFASSSCAFCPQTGLGMGATDTSEGATGDGFVAPLLVQPGEGYFLLVDNWTANATGFDLTWSNAGSNYLNCNAEPCSVTATVSNILCDDNGTPTDPSDDTFSFDVLVEGTNVGNSFCSNDPNNTSGSFGGTFNFGPYDIGNGDLNFAISDCANSGCFIDVEVLAPPTCSDDCEIMANVTNILCDDNATPNDPTDDTFTFDITVTEINGGSGWSADDPNNSSDNYNTVVTLGPYDIADGDLSFTITDNDDTNCTFLVNVTAPPTCSDACDIMANVSNIMCNDNGTPTDPSDDTYTFDVTVTGTNTSSSWTADDASNTTGAYGVAVTFGPYPISGGSVTVLITDDGDSNCTASVDVNPPVSCSDACDIMANVSNIMCNDNGTPTDPSDDTYTFDVTVTGTNTASSWTADDASNTTGAYGVAVTFGPYPISGGSVTVLITDDGDSNCTVSIDVNPPATCSDECQIMANVSNIMCNDNGTATDPTDDTYTFDVVVTGLNTGTTWFASDANSTSGTYNTTVTFGPYSIDGGALNITISDGDTPSCLTSIMVTPPQSCSDACQIMASTNNINCNDNGTPSDPTDDVFYFDVTVTGINTATSWIADDPSSSTGNYGVVTTLGPFNISDGSVSITFTDNDDPSCTANVLINPPSTCSDECQIMANATNIMCSDNGTPTDPSDDTFTFDVTVTGLNVGMGWTANDPNASSGIYDMLTSFGPYNIVDGNLSFVITDSDDSGCTVIVNVTAPPTCSDECVIMANTTNIACNNNGTPSDPDDDTFTFDVVVTGSNTGASWIADDPSSTTGTYGNTVSFGPFNIADGSTSIIFTDIDDSACTVMIDVTPPATCSGTCSISNNVSNILCDDNGTPTDPSDDTFTFDVTVTGSNIGASWIADDPNATTGLYGVVVSFGPYDISSGNFSFTITDIDDPSCTTDVMISAPATCSDDCEILAVESNILCDDNGTPTDPTDDTYTFDVLVSGSNTGASWTANDPNSTSGSYDVVQSFGPFAISDGNLNFTIVDINDSGCTSSLMIVPPATCSDECEIIALDANVLCDDNGTPSDPSDDTFTFEVDVSGSNVSSSWTADDPNTTTGGYNTTTTFGPYNISNGDLVINIIDDANLMCSATLNISAPATCSDECEISAQVQNILCNDNGTPTDPSDDTFTFEVTVTGSNTGTGWTANDPNTTTGSYGVTETFGPFSIAGGNLNFTISDNATSTCNTPVSVTAPSTCSDQCMIEAISSNIVCNDNGTPSDPDDDTYTFDVIVSGSNTGSSWTANDANGTTGLYGVTVSFGPYLISDGNINITISDDSNASCTDDFVITPPNTCSGTCSISNIVSNILCNDSGTPSDPSDDTFSFTVLVTGSNIGPSWTANDPNNTSGLYGVGESFGPFAISDGDLNFIITDVDDPSCTTTINVTAPSTCSDECLISHMVSNILCDDNGTPSDPSDDSFTFEVEVTGSNTASTWIANDPNGTSGSYNSTVVFGPYLISDGNLSFNITDGNDSGCSTLVSVMAPPTCSDLCSIQNMVSNILCDDNGTPTDPSDDIFTFEVVVTGSNTDMFWTANDPNNTMGTYGATVVFGPFLISDGDLNFTIVDDFDSNCTTSVSVSVPATCSDLCEIMASVSNELCDDNGTPADPSDDLYFFDVTVVGSNTSSGWTANDPNTTTGSYGATVVFGPYPISGGNLNFTINDNNEPTCATTVLALTPPTCSDECSISLAFTNILCNDAGTPSDPDDDTFTVDIEVNGINVGTSWIANDPNNTTGAYGSSVNFGPFLIANGNPTIVFTDSNDPLCTEAISIQAPNSCSGTCSISNIVSNIQCLDNGTPTDPSDDLYTFDIEVNGSNTSASWTANDPNGTSGVYGVVQSFGPYPISDGVLNFVIFDDAEPSCTSIVGITPPDACSNLCTLSSEVDNIICDDNGTPNDPTDDTYSFQVFVTGTNTGSSWVADDPNMTSGSYNNFTLFGPYPISGGNVTFNIVDGSDPSCFSFEEVIAPMSCSDQCEISVIQTNVACNDNGTPTDPSDDTFTFDVLVTGSNTSIAWSADDPNNTAGAYNMIVSCGPFAISGGDFVMMIVDDGDPNCFTEINVVAPSTCSDLCIISATTDNIICDNNGTPSDPSDDWYYFDAIITGVNVSGGWSSNDPNGVSGQYNTLTTFGPYPIVGGDLNFLVTDASESNCFVNVNVMAPMTCSDECDIEAIFSNVLCDDAGTPNDPADDIFSFEVTVTGVNNASTWIANDVNATSGNYDTPTIFGPFLIADGNPNIVITDSADPSCTTNINVLAPATCSGTCSIGNSISNYSCDDAGTPTDPSDDLFYFEVLVNGSNTGVSWNSDDPNSGSGMYGVPVVLGPYLIADGDFNFSIFDDDTPSCFTNVAIAAPSTCSDLCEVNAVVDNIVCNDAGTTSDASDDYFTFDVMVSGSNTGSSWNANDPNSTSGSYNTTISFGPYLIVDGDLNFDLIDGNDGQCLTSVLVESPMACSNSCSLDYSVTNVVCDDNGTPTDANDDTFSFDFLLNGTNVGSSWTANDPNNFSGTYGVMLNMGPYNISDGDLNFDVFDDVDNSCATTVTVEAPNTCSPPCTIDYQLNNLTCDDSGTPIDPSDDTFSFMLDLSNMNGGSGWSSNDPTNATGVYGTGILFGPYPIAGGDLNFTITDAEVMGCSVEILIVAPNTCSGTCSIANSISNIQCDDNGTITDPSDDTFTFDVLISGSNTGTNWLANDADMTSGSYNLISSFGPFLIANGNVSLTFTDSEDQNCTTELMATAPDPCSGSCTLQIETQQTNASCFGSAEGSILLTITGAVGNTQVVWDPSSVTGTNPMNLTAGSYSVTVTDDENCVETTTVIIEEPELLEMTCGEISVVSVPGGDDGEGFINIIGGTEPFSVSWLGPNGLNGSEVGLAQGPLSLLNLTAGSYTVTVIDANLCEVECTFTINEEGCELVLNGIASDVSCFDGNDGSIELTVTGANGNTTFSWDVAGVEGSNPSGLSAGTYTVTIEDDAACTLIETFVIENALEYNADIVANPQIINLGESSVLTTSTNLGETSIADILWDNQSTVECVNCLETIVTPSETTEYTIQLIDENGCIIYSSIIVDVINIVDIYIPNVFSPNGDGNNDYFFPISRESSIEIIEEMVVYDRWGNRMFFKENFAPGDPIEGWDGRFKGESLNPGVFVYVIKARLANGQLEIMKGDITIVH